MLSGFSIRKAVFVLNKYQELLNAMSGLRGPRLIYENADRPGFRQLTAVEDPSTGARYKYMPYAVDSGFGGDCLVDASGEAHKAPELFPYDPVGMSEEDCMRRAEDFSMLGEFARELRSALPELSADQRATLCSRVAADFEGLRMRPTSFCIDDAGPAFHMMQANVSQLQDGFLEYIQSGCNLQSYNYMPGLDTWHQDDLKAFERSSKHQVYQTMALCGSKGEGLSEREQEEVLIFSDVLTEACAEHALYASEFAKNQGIKFRDFGLAAPYACETKLPDMVLDHHMFGVREFEKAKLQGICARDFSEFETPAPRSRDTRDLDAAVSELEGQSGMESSVDYDL